MGPLPGPWGKRGPRDLGLRAHAGCCGFLCLGRAVVDGERDNHHGQDRQHGKGTKGLDERES